MTTALTRRHLLAAALATGVAVPLGDAGRGCDHDSHRRFVRARGITPVIARRGTAHGSNLGTLRWVNARPTQSLRRRRDESTRQTTPFDRVHGSGRRPRGSADQEDA